MGVVSNLCSRRSLVNSQVLTLNRHKRSSNIDSKSQIESAHHLSVAAKDLLGLDLSSKCELAFLGRYRVLYVNTSHGNMEWKK